jgi:hemerythrin superfamily protein
MPLAGMTPSFHRSEIMAARKKGSKSAAPRRAANAITLLKSDHTAVQELFDKYEKTRSSDRKAALAEQICNELRVHAQIEEEIFYPAAREALRDQDLLDEAQVEHASAKELIAQIESGRPGEDLFDAKVKVLGEYVKHHVKEEQNELFPKVRKTKLDLQELGEKLQARKDALMAELK